MTTTFVEGNNAIAGRITAKQALNAATQRAQQEWETFTRQYGGK